MATQHHHHKISNPSFRLMMYTEFAAKTRLFLVLTVISVLRPRRVTGAESNPETLSPVGPGPAGSLYCIPCQQFAEAVECGISLCFLLGTCNHREMVTKVKLDKKGYAEAKATDPTTIILNATGKKIFDPS